MRIGEVAKRSGVSVKTIRYYEEIEVLGEPRRLASGYRDYDIDTIERLQFILASQASGLSLGEIKGIVAYRDRGESPCSHVLDLLRRRSDEIDAQIEELKRSKTIINKLVTRSRKLRPEDCSASSVCHLITKDKIRI
ncbi:MAG: MerR family transcriptional regulator [Acidimicrobiales bacterium]